MIYKSNKHILVIGPTGSGKSYISEKFREMGVNAVDADTIEGLCQWYNAKGEPVKFPKNADKNFLDTHTFLWDKEVLRTYLSDKNEIYIMGMAGNIWDVLDLFNKVYYLDVDSTTLDERLQHPNRSNPMGKTEYQRKTILNYAESLKIKARNRFLSFVKATKSPEEIFKEITESSE